MDPAAEQARAGFQPTPAQYRYYWQLYTNSAFEDALRWLPYKQKYRLYRNTRSIYNPFGRLVDFYAGQVYGGVLTDDGLSLPNGANCAIPLDPNTPEELRLAIVQAWRWSNMQSMKSVIVRYGAALGETFLEVVEDTQRQKVWIQNWWPGFVDDVVVSPQGNVQSYALEYMVTPEPERRHGQVLVVERPFRYRKEVDRMMVRTYKDDKPYGYDGNPPEWEHGLGFCPAAWVKHKDYGGDHGANAWESSQAKLEELNALASRINDQIHKVVAAPVIFWTNSKITSLTSKSQPVSERDEVSNPDAGRDGVMILKGPQDGRREPLVGDLNLADALAASAELIGEIEADHPELTMWSELRQMSQVTGPAARRLTGDTLPRIGEASANYDMAMTACQGMAVAIAGQRLADGDWDAPTRQHDPFRHFDLTSYSKGELDHNIMPRSVVEDTMDEKLDRALKQQALGIDPETIYIDLGYDEDRLAAMRVRQAQAETEKMERQMSMLSNGFASGAFGGGPFGGPALDPEEIE